MRIWGTKRKIPIFQGYIFSWSLTFVMSTLETPKALLGHPRDLKHSLCEPNFLQNNRKNATEYIHAEQFWGKKLNNAEKCSIFCAFCTCLNLCPKTISEYSFYTLGSKESFYGLHRCVTHFLFAVLQMRRLGANWGIICSFAGYRRNFCDIGHILQYSLKFWWSCITNEKDLCY